MSQQNVVAMPTKEDRDLEPIKQKFYESLDLDELRHIIDAVYKTGQKASYQVTLKFAIDGEGEVTVEAPTKTIVPVDTGEPLKGEFLRKAGTNPADLQYSLSFY